MVRHVVRNLDLRADGIAPRNAGIARVQWCIVDSLTFRTFVEPATYAPNQPNAKAAYVEQPTSEPVIPPASLSLGAIRVVTARLPSDIRTLQCSGLKAIFGSLLLCVGRQVPWSKKLVNQSLILADPIGEHATVITISIKTPLYIHCIATLVSDDGLGTPARAGLVIIHRNASIVAARTAAANFRRVKIRPRSYGLEDGAFGTSVYS